MQALGSSIRGVLAESRAGGHASPSADEIRDWLSRRIADELGVDPEEVRADVPLERYGLDSRIIAGIAGDKIDMDRRLARLERLLTSPYLPPVVREQVTNKRLTAIEANRKLAMIPEVP